jgi:hypothetical protein
MNSRSGFASPSPHIFVTGSRLWILSAFSMSYFHLTYCGQRAFLFLSADYPDYQSQAVTRSTDGYWVAQVPPEGSKSDDSRDDRTQRSPCDP